MQLNIYSSIMIFLGSYTPLSLILLIQDIDMSLISKPFCINLFREGCSLPLSTPQISISAMVVCVICLLVTFFAINQTNPKTKAKLTNIKPIPSELINYSLPYIVTLMSINYSETNEIFGFFIFMVWMFIINHKNGTIILNPLLSVIGWKLYEVQYKRIGESAINNGRLLYRGRLAENASIKFENIQDIMIAVDQ